MIKRKEELSTTLYEKCCGGDGITQVTDFLNEKDVYPQVTTVAYAKITKDDSIGWHIHADDMEAYIILKGSGIFNDNGIEHIVYPMDVTLTYKGEGHSIRTIDTELELIAVIMKK